MLSDFRPIIDGEIFYDVFSSDLRGDPKYFQSYCDGSDTIMLIIRDKTNKQKQVNNRAKIG